MLLAPFCPLDNIPPGGITYFHMLISTQNAKLIRRLKIIAGQVRGLQEMLASHTYCIDIITQTSAIKRALSGVEDLLMENHLSSCAIEQIKSGKEKKAKEEILKVYRLKRK